MASAIHPDFRDDATYEQATFADRETVRLVRELHDAEEAEDWDIAIGIARTLLDIRLRVYKPESPPVGGAWATLGGAYQSASRLNEAEEAIKKCAAIYEGTATRDEKALTR